MPKKAKYLKFKIGGKWIYTKSVKGQQPNRFVERTIKSTESPVNAIFNKALDEIVKKI